MSGSGKRTNPVLFLASAILCLGAGFAVTQTSDEPSSIQVSALPEVLSFAEKLPGQNLSDSRADLADDSAGSADSKDSITESSTQPDLSEVPAASEPAGTSESPADEEPSDQNLSADDQSVHDQSAHEENQPAREDPASALPSEIPADQSSASPSEASAESGDSWFVHEFSPEASSGTWTYLDEHWYLVTDAGTYRGWLYDPDGHIYYFDPDDGTMTTGWIELDGQIYYFDLDGIMQTGIHIIDGTEYHFRPDGTLKGYIDLTPTPAPQASPADASSVNASGNTSAESVDPEDASSQNSAAEQPSISEQPDQTTAVLTDGSNTLPRYVALTFDDGPGSYTERLLDILEQNNAKATFFMVGEELQYHKELLPRMEALGCELGNHTWSHANLTELDFDGISQEIGRTNELIYEAVGHDATVIRPPYGAIDSNVRASLAAPMILWSVDTLDWESKDVEMIIETTFENITPGSIILMHDIYETSVDAAEILIPELKSIGYEFVTVHELAALYNQELHAGVAYGSMN